MPPVKKGQIDLQLVVKVAVEIADQQGFEAVSLARVADELSIRIPSLYNYVSGLSGLREQMTLWGIRQATDQFRRATVGKAGDDAVYALAIVYREFAQTHPGIYAAALRGAPADTPELTAAGQEIVELVAAVIGYYGFTGDAAIHAVRVLRSVLHGFVDIEVAGGFGIPLDPDETFRRLIQILIQGLHAQQDKTL